MKYLKFNIDIYDWDIYYIEVERKKDSKAVIAKLRSIPASKELINEVRDDIKSGSKNGGHHLFNLVFRKSVILLYQTTNKKDRINIIFHEKRHVEDRLCKHLDIDDMEASAFLAGYIAEKLIPIL
jgi:hypothetical protein